MKKGKRYVASLAQFDKQTAYEVGAALENAYQL